MTRILRSVLPCLLLPALVACGKPKAPDKEQPPAPQASERHSQLRAAVRRPIDRARQADAEVQKAADTQRAAIDAATGG